MNTGSVKFHREAQPHQLPGICGSLLGFILLLTGIALITVHANAESTSKTVEILGPICLVFGVILVIAGFAHKFIQHRRFKSKQQQYTQRRRSSTNSSYINGDLGASGGRSFSDIHLKLENGGEGSSLFTISGKARNGTKTSNKFTSNMDMFSTSSNV